MNIDRHGACMSMTTFGSHVPVVWVTRTLPVARDSATRLARLGYECLVSPLMRVSFSRTTPDLRGVGALVFTSRNGVAAFVRRRSERNYQVFAVGDATARAACDAGFQQVASAAGDVTALRELVRARGQRNAGAVLRVGAAEPAGTLIADLTADGFEVANWSAYRTIPVGEQQVLEQVGGRARGLDAVLVYSPKAARRLAVFLEKHRLQCGDIICISPAAAAPVQRRAAYRVHVAQRPDEASLFAALSLI